MDKEKKFDRIKYNTEYNRQHYKQLKIETKAEIIEDIRAAAKEEGKSVTQYIIDLHNEHKGHI